WKGTAGNWAQPATARVAAVAARFRVRWAMVMFLGAAGRESRTYADRDRRPGSRFRGGIRSRTLAARRRVLRMHRGRSQSVRSTRSALVRTWPLHAITLDPPREGRPRRAAWCTLAAGSAGADTTSRHHFHPQEKTM